MAMDSETDIDSPFPFRISPFVDGARAHMTNWVRQTGLVRRASAGQRFERADFGWFAAVVYPAATAPRLDLLADWFAWLFLVDDQLDDGEFGRDPDHLRTVIGQLRTVLESTDGQVDLGVRAPTAVSALADLWRRTAVRATAEWRRRFVRHLELCLSTAADWEAGNRQRAEIPSEDSYIANRRHTGAIYPCMDLIEIAEGISIRDDLHRSPEFTAALDAACDVVCWTNDVYSLEKERSLGEVHNLVYLVQHHRGLDPRSALDHVHRAIERQTERFIEAEARVLSTYPEFAAELKMCLAGMRSWMRGNLDWSRQTKRYLPPSDTGAAAPEHYLETRLVEVER
ncbi:terpene cyclase [Streptomyces sp. NPDC050759]|uniref:terpene synthase family protein n=1 Tax=Streptomyces sp. NPDC050759 TaxID=3365635 RepID=UPI0037A242B5